MTTIGEACITWDVTPQVRPFIALLTTGWIYTRLVFKGAYVLSRFHEYEKEWEVLSELLDQKLFRRGRRGEWWERRALVEVQQSPLTLLIFRSGICGNTIKADLKFMSRRNGSKSPLKRANLHYKIRIHTSYSTHGYRNGYFVSKELSAFRKRNNIPLRTLLCDRQLYENLRE